MKYPCKVRGPNVLLQGSVVTKFYSGVDAIDIKKYSPSGTYLVPRADISIIGKIINDM